MASRHDYYLGAPSRTKRPEEGSRTSGSRPKPRRLGALQHSLQPFNSPFSFVSLQPSSPLYSIHSGTQVTAHSSFPPFSLFLDLSQAPFDPNHTHVLFFLNSGISLMDILSVPFSLLHSVRTSHCKSYFLHQA